MFNVLIDTSVWLDLAQDQKQAPLIDPLIAMVSRGSMNLLVPRIVITEFQKNRRRVAERVRRSLGTHFNVVKDAIRKVDGDSKQKHKILQYLSDVDHRIPLVGGATTDTLDRIETLLKAATAIETNAEVKLRAADRALNRKAPCHHENKNAIADAVLIETYFECVRRGNAGERFAFMKQMEASGLLMPSVSRGLAWVTPVVYSNGKVAQAELALSRTPDGYWAIPGRNFQMAGAGLLWTTVKPTETQPGGGIEGTTSVQIPLTGAKWVTIGH